MKKINNIIEKIKKNIERDLIIELEHNTSILRILLLFMGKCIIIVGFIIIFGTVALFILMDASTVASTTHELIMYIRNTNDFEPEVLVKHFNRLLEVISKEAYGQKIIVRGQKYYISYMTNEEIMNNLLQPREVPFDDIKFYHKRKYEEIIKELKEQLNNDYTKKQKEILQKFINKFEEKNKRLDKEIGTGMCKSERSFIHWKLLFGYSLKFPIIVVTFWWFLN